MRFSAVILFLLLPAQAPAGDFNFNWDSANDMRGAWTFCAPTGFTQGECPKVWRKCHQFPLWKCNKKGKKCKTVCTGVPSFSTSQADVVDALNTVQPGQPHPLVSSTVMDNAYNAQRVRGNQFQPVAPVCDSFTGVCTVPSSVAK